MVLAVNEEAVESRRDRIQHDDLAMIAERRGEKV
jgi:hypothetical protein